MSTTRLQKGAGTGKHDHVVFETDAPARIIFNDHRRFGLMTLVETATLEDDKLFAGMGLEPLSPGFNTKYLIAALEGKKTPIKSALLDQRVVAGLGNIYVCEALFRAKISPKRLAGAVENGTDRAVGGCNPQSPERCDRSRRIHLARPCPGDRRSRQFPTPISGLWREGLRCKLNCPGTVKRIVQAGRSTFYCPKCQS